MAITFDDHIPGYDHVIARLDGVPFGFRGIKSGTIGVTRCPECHKENYALAVNTGMCMWCGWDARKELDPE